MNCTHSGPREYAFREQTVAGVVRTPLLWCGRCGAIKYGIDQWRVPTLAACIVGGRRISGPVFHFDRPDELDELLTVRDGEKD